VQCSWAATRKKNGYLSGKYISILARRGRKKALIAVAHKIIIAAYHILKDKVAYKEPVHHVDGKRVIRQIESHLAKLKELGHPVVLGM